MLHTGCALACCCPSSAAVPFALWWSVCCAPTPPSNPLLPGHCCGGVCACACLPTLLVPVRSITKTGGGGNLVTAPDTDLSIPFTITATKRTTSTVGYVAGKVTVQNSAATSVTISSLSIALSGGQPSTIPVSNCASPTLAAQGTTSCSFNVSNPAAPAAGSVTASVTLQGVTSAATSAPAQYDYSTASTFNIGGTASIYDVVDTSGLVSILGNTVNTGTNTFIRYEPADQHPPETAPGLTLDDSRTFSYNLIVRRLGQCATSLTVGTHACS
jgi:hypothetical protein